MANAVEAYRQALSSFRGSIVDYVVYSLAASVASAVLGLIVALSLSAFAIVTVGSLVSLLASGNLLSLSALGIAFTLLVMLGGLVVFMLLQSGLNGAYLETVSMLLAGRKQSIAGFFSAVPRQAPGMLAASILTSIIVVLPSAAAFAVGGLAGLSSIPGIAAAIAGLFISFVLLLLMIFVAPAVAVGKRSAIAALGDSLAHVIRSPLAFIIFLLLSGLLLVPAAILPLNLVYIPLFLMPVWTAALVAFYRQ